MRRISAAAISVGLLVCAFGAVTAAPALANKDPHRVFLPSGPLDLPAGYCSFPTHYDVVVNKEYGKITTLADGTTRIHETGSFKVRATNVDSERSVLLNASGPGTILIHPDGTVDVVGTGHWLITNLATDAAPFGLPGVMLTSGTLNESLDASATPTALSVTGRAIDVCAAIA
jgi:hypothetical protein